jgi:UDP-glucose 4-epimerase
MRIFVTGGAGYVGSHCVKDLCAHGHEVVVYDDLSRGHRGAIHPEARLVAGNLADTDTLTAALSSEPFDAAMHFAAFAYVGESVRDPLRYYRNNVANSLSLLEALRNVGPVPPARRTGFRPLSP